jgi:hypothetical protein
MINDLDHLLAQTQVSAIITSLDTELSRIKQLNEPKHEPFKVGTQKHLESMKEVLLHLMRCEKELRTLLSVNFNLHKQVMELMNDNEKLKIQNANLMQGL